MKWLLNRLREPSTWRGLVWLATVAGLSLRPDQAEAIVTAGIALAGLLGVFLADQPPIELQSVSNSRTNELRDTVPAKREGRPSTVNGNSSTGWNG